MKLHLKEAGISSTIFVGLWALYVYGLKALDPPSPQVSKSDEALQALTNDLICAGVYVFSQVMLRQFERSRTAASDTEQLLGNEATLQARSQCRSMGSAVSTMAVDGFYHAITPMGIMAATGHAWDRTLAPRLESIGLAGALSTKVLALTLLWTAKCELFLRCGFSRCNKSSSEKWGRADQNTEYAMAWLIQLSFCGVVMAFDAYFQSDVKKTMACSMLSTVGLAGVLTVLGVPGRLKACLSSNDDNEEKNEYSSMT